MSSANPFLRRVLGEDATPPTMPSAQTAMSSDPEPADVKAEAEKVLSVEPRTEELANLWRSGDKMGVASRLMFSPASYVDFVDLCFIIGQSEARALGQLLDELADTESIPVPKPSGPQGSRILKNIAAHREDVDNNI